MQQCLIVLLNTLLYQLIHTTTPSSEPYIMKISKRGQDNCCELTLTYDLGGHAFFTGNNLATEKYLEL